mmetsp:Transcript_1264/g.1806  ORF Transcript_1264/g.1806 Transcript_1264/m.1806 type:complete len:1106 (+) Transcript_1264:219-3536(+)|eukprot:CAMPEP_0184869322 /NCGR_PEP_ID=MMETSP0580-20130426/33649_1 /TAXON_ID=1118495 /ORGANISM="Dactyliosolen fragilissimus" /LENGTH=1105 /DNA_ID=CAMNT_0027370731 /DNA_START=164 /DNA_END=3481 /DNA_ORIENTATION=-
MTKYDVATIILVASLFLNNDLSLRSANGFSLQNYAVAKSCKRTEGGGTRSNISASLSSSLDENENEKSRMDLTDISSSVTAAFREANNLVVEDIDNLERNYDESVILTRKERKLKSTVLKKSTGTILTTYQITLPIATRFNQPSASSAMGLSLREVSKGYTFSVKALDFDSLTYFDFEEEQMRRSSNFSSASSQSKTVNDENDGVSENIIISMGNEDEKEFREFHDRNFNGIVVSSVLKGSIAWEKGVRVGDALIATSATIGKKMWPKSTLEGVRSAISSRKVMSSEMEFKFQRSTNEIAESEVVVEEIELSIPKPIGFNVEDSKDGYVQITGFTDQASSIVKSILQKGDRVVAVDSSLGSEMWPVTNVEGLVSACTSRIPGQPVKLQFERVIESTDLINSKSADKTNLSNSEIKYSGSNIESTRYSASIGTVTNTMDSSGEDYKNKLELISRCRKILRRYASVNDASSEKSIDVLSLVTDRVVDSLIEASISIDARTLSLIMNSYLLCKRPTDAINIFESAVGLAADGSSRPALNLANMLSGKYENGATIIPDDDALSLYTATLLIRAHAKLGDCLAARRVFAAMEGKEVEIGKVNSFRWPKVLSPDTKCYNAVMDAASKAGTSDGLEMALELFNNMAQPVLFRTVRPKRSLVSYNIIISALARNFKRKEAFETFYDMMENGLKPDKFTITSLIKATMEDDDIQAARDLLRDMRKANIKADVVAYNTIIRKLCAKRQWFEAKSFVTEMEVNGISPDSKTYGLLMHSLLKANKPGPCLTLFESACSDQRSVFLTENVQLYTTAITAAATLGDYERSLELVSRMTFAGVKPNIKTLTSLMGACLTAAEYDYALKIFSKITSPDGYAMTLALRGYCGRGDYEKAFELLTDQSDAGKEMSGRQIMSSYNLVIEEALNAKQYRDAKRAMTDLLKAGYVPSKKTFKIIANSLGLSRNRATTVQGTNVKDYAIFGFALFVFDSLDARKIPCDAFFYSSVLMNASRVGGLFKKIASLLVKSRGDDNVLSSDRSNMDPATVIKLSEKQCLNWEDLLYNYSDYRDTYEDMVLPSVRIRVDGKNIKQLLAAERSVSYGHSRRRSSGKREKRALYN